MSMPPAARVVEKPILCSPYAEPTDHWAYSELNEPYRAGSRRTAGYFYRTERTGSAQRSMFAEEHREDLPLVNALRDGGLTRLGCKMATGSGKTVVMAMLMSWAFCNRAANPRSEQFPDAALVCCPNLTVKERLQVLRPDHPDNYYAAFDIVPAHLLTRMSRGMVLIANWHQFAPASEHREGDKTYAVVQKGAETDDVFARRVLGELYGRGPILVLNDEAHHCWRPRPGVAVSGEAKADDGATVWVSGLDRLNAAGADGKPGVRCVVDLSATPFYLGGSGYAEGSPFPWLVSDFGLMDAIESGVTKIPRVPVNDDSGRPDPKYFRLWDAIKDELQAGDKLPGRQARPKPEAVYKYAEGALTQLFGQWREQFRSNERHAAGGKLLIPPVLIVVCDNTDVSKVFYEKISGETEGDLLEADPDLDGDDETPAPAKGKAKKAIRYGTGVLGELLSNRPGEPRRTIPIDEKALGEAEADRPGQTKSDAAEQLRQIVSTVGREGKPGEQVRCVVAVSMLNEGWDSQNVTHILGVRAFGSQLLCEQVVGRGLRRIDYTPDPDGMLPEEYVDVFGIPFSVVPYRGKSTNAPPRPDPARNLVKALDERKRFEIMFPVVEGFTFELRKNLIRCDVSSVPPVRISPQDEPTETELKQLVGYAAGPVKHHAGGGHRVTLDDYLAEHRLSSTLMELAKRLTHQLMDTKPAFRMQARTQLFPQVFAIVRRYAAGGIDAPPGREPLLALERFLSVAQKRLLDAIEPDDTAGEEVVLPVFNPHKKYGTTAGVWFTTPKPTHGTAKSHVSHVVADSAWEGSAAFHLEGSDLVECYVKNTEQVLTLPYEDDAGGQHHYTPDFLVRLAGFGSADEPHKRRHVVLETKGFLHEADHAKHAAARRWCAAVSNWGGLGAWEFVLARSPQEAVPLLRERAACPPGRSAV
jgi:type III restriction enzyme